MKKKTRCVIAVAAAIVLLAIDQLTKLMAVRTVKINGPHVLLDGILEFRYLENNGAAWGMLTGAKVLFVAIAIIVTVILAWVYLRIPDEKRFVPLRICCVMLVSGALGNMIDRFAHGYVVDFISTLFIRFPIFNVADIYVTVSAFGLAVLIIFCYKEEDLKFLNGKKDGKNR